jgi:hypothetical protein
MERLIAAGQRVGTRRAVDPDRREWTGVGLANAPRVQQHAGQITGVVGVKVRDEHSFQTSEVEPRVNV